jgi:hypothetical protein
LLPLAQVGGGCGTAVAFSRNDPGVELGGKGGGPMSQRDANLLWLKDIIEHLGECHQQLDWADDPDAVRLLTETMLRDLESCRRLCATLQRQGSFQGVN